MDKLYIVIPAYNESENIEQIIKQWHPVVSKTGPDSRLVIVDDGSKDDTYEIAKRCTAEYPRLIALTKENGGHGAAVLFAYNYALNSGADYIFQTDSDGQTMPDEFWKFWEARHSYDIIIGQRTKRQDGLMRVFVTKVLKLLLFLTFGVMVPDANTPFRLMEAGVLKENIKLVPENFYLSNVILSVIYTKKKMRIKYFPITFMERQGGVNSINLKKIFKIGAAALKDFISLNKKLKGKF